MSLVAIAGTASFALQHLGFAYYHTKNMTKCGYSPALSCLVAYPLSFMVFILEHMTPYAESFYFLDRLVGGGQFVLIELCMYKDLDNLQNNTYGKAIMAGTIVIFGVVGSLEPPGLEPDFATRSKAVYTIPYFDWASTCSYASFWYSFALGFFTS